jgi:hypothetical protein
MKKTFLTLTLTICFALTALSKPILVLGKSKTNPCIGFWVVVDDKTGAVYGGGTYNLCRKTKTNKAQLALEVAKKSIDDIAITKNLNSTETKEVNAATITKYFNSLLK